jgi:DNA-binding PadR family transcriptional regulator
MAELERMTSEKYIPEPGAAYTMLRRMEERSLITSEWAKKETDADRRVYTLTDGGMNALKEGLEMVERRRQEMERLVHFYNAQFEEKKEGGNA